MKKMITALLVFSLIVVGVSTVSSAYNGYGNTKGRPFADSQREYNYRQNNPLDLTEEQLEKMDTLHNDFFAERDETRENLWEANSQLRELQLNNAGEQEIAELRNKINNLQTELNNLRFNHQENIKNMLTEEQIEELKEFHDDYGYGGKRGASVARNNNQRGGRGRGTKGNRFK